MRGRKLELEHFLSQQGVDICLLIETFFNPGQAFRLANYICHGTESPPWYSPPLNARSGPDPLGGYCLPSHIGRKTGVNPCDLLIAYPPTDLSGPNRLFRQAIAGLDGWRPQRQTRGLELAAEHETEETLT